MTRRPDLRNPRTIRSAQNLRRAVAWGCAALALTIFAVTAARAIPKAEYDAAHTTPEATAYAMEMQQ